MKIQATLLADLEAFLALCTNDRVRCVGQCISRMALPLIARCLALPPQLANWRTARDCPPIHHLHTIAQLAGLIHRHPQNKLLQLTPFALSWLNQTPGQQLTQLQSAFNNADALKATWLALLLPGHKFMHPEFAFQPLLAQAHSQLAQKSATPSSKHISALAKAFALQSVSVVPSVAIASEFAATFLALHQQLHTAQGPHKIQGTCLLMADPGKDGWVNPHAIYLPLCPTLTAGQRHAFSQIALLQHTMQAQGSLHRHYLLDSNHLRRAWQNGLSLRHIRNQLEEATANPLPEIVVWQLRRWERQWQQMRVYPATILEVSDPALLEEATRSRPIRACIARTLSPRAVVVRPNALPALLRRLRRRGAQPSVRPGLGDEARIGYRLEQPDLAHAYISALLFHHLADSTSLNYRPPFAAVEALGQALSPNDHAFAHQLLTDALDDLERSRSRASQPAQPMLSTMSFAHEERWVAQLQTDIQIGAQRQFTYRAANGQLSQRTVSPHRIEWHDAVPYLIAFCHLAQDERTFRIDRIQREAESYKR